MFGRMQSILGAALICFPVTTAIGGAGATDFTVRMDGVFVEEGNEFAVTGTVTEQEPWLGFLDFTALFTVDESGDPDIFAGAFTFLGPEGTLSGTMSGVAIFLGDLKVLAGEFEFTEGLGIYEGVTGTGVVGGIAESGRDPLPIFFEFAGTAEGTSCTTALDGDMDFNGCTDFNDLLLVLSFWDQTDSQGDGNCDGVVDFNDLLLVLSGWSDEGECD